MNRSTKLLLEIAAFAVMIAAFVAVTLLAVRISSGEPHWASGFAVGVSIFSAVIGAFVAIYAGQQRGPRDNHAVASIRDELERRKLGGLRLP